MLVTPTKHQCYPIVSHPKISRGSTGNKLGGIGRVHIKRFIDLIGDYFMKLVCNFLGCIGSGVKVQI